MVCMPLDISKPDFSIVGFKLPYTTTPIPFFLVFFPYLKPKKMNKKKTEEEKELKMLSHQTASPHKHFELLNNDKNSIK